MIAEGSYSIDDASEDEEQANTQYATRNQQQPSSTAQTGPAISQEHFSAVLAMLNQQQQPSRRVVPAATQLQQPQQVVTPPLQNSGGAFFDRSHFQNIMQQIMSQQQPQQQQQAQAQPTSSSDQAQTITSTGSQISNDLAAKLEQMHEFGFFDDTLNIRALEITEGNVEAAISLIIEGGDMI